MNLNDGSSTPLWGDLENVDGIGMNVPKKQQPSTPELKDHENENEDGSHPMAACESSESYPDHRDVREILADAKIISLMKEMEPLRSSGKEPKCTYTQLDNIVYEYTGLQVKQLVTWDEETWIVCSPSNEVQPGMNRHHLVGSLFYRIL